MEVDVEAARESMREGAFLKAISKKVYCRRKRVGERLK